MRYPQRGHLYGGLVLGFDAVEDLAEIASVVDQGDIQSRLKVSLSPEHGF